MTWHRVIASRLRGLVAAGRLDREIEDELHSHVEMETEANLRRGMTPEEARRAALREFGGVTQVAEAWREHRGFAWVQTFLRDLRFAFRLCRSNPGFTFAAAAPLAIAMAFVTAVLALVNAVFFRPMGVTDPGSLATLYAFSRQQGRYQSLSYPEFRDARGLRDQVESAAAYVRIPVNANLGEGTEQFWGELATGDYFHTLGVLPILGRPLGTRDDRPDAPAVTVISYAFWDSAFRRSPSALGASLAIDGVPFTVVGVLPRGFIGTVLDWSPPPAFWIPLARIREMVPAVRALDFENRREVRWLLVSARLRRPVRQVQAALDVVNARERGEYGLRAIPFGKARFFPDFRDASIRFAWVLLGLCGAVLLVACSTWPTCCWPAWRRARRRSARAWRWGRGRGASSTSSSWKARCWRPSPWRRASRSRFG